MTDFTSEITALQRARVDMQTEKATNKITVKAKYAERIRQEIADADEAAEIRFARLLATAANAGIPQSILRSEVLRTNDWSRWVYWRDLAEIEPERVIISNARDARKKADANHRWVKFDSDFGYALVITKDTNGNEIPETTFTDIQEKNGKIVARADAWDHPEHRDIAREFFEEKLENLYNFATAVATANRKEINK